MSWHIPSVTIEILPATPFLVCYDTFLLLTAIYMQTSNTVVQCEVADIKHCCVPSGLYCWHAGKNFVQFNQSCEGQFPEIVFGASYSMQSI